MAANISKISLLRSTATRGYATAQNVPINGISSFDVKTTTLPNKLTVATAENDAAITRVSVVVRAGSRNETPENAGVTHVLRIAAGLTTKKASQFAIIRNIQEVGCNLYATNDREVISYTLEGSKGSVESVLPFLSDVVTQQVFHPWEISDNTPRLQLELATRSPQLRAVDLLHKAAFRSVGLGNSLFISKHRLGKISSETLQHYVGKQFVTGRTAVIGSGINHSELVQYAQTLELGNSDGFTTPSPYKGGEIRSDKGGDYAFVAIGGEGGSIKDALTYGVLRRALGIGPQIKWSWNDNAALSKAIGTAVTEQYAISALNASYADTGLFGVLIAAPSNAVGKIVDTVVKVLKSGSIGDEFIAKGIKQLQTSILLGSESGANVVENLGYQAAILREAQSPALLANAVASVKPEDVKSALRKVGNKLSIASVGNLTNVPFLDDLK